VKLQTEAADRLLDATRDGLSEVEAAAIELALEAVTSCQRYYPGTFGVDEELMLSDPEGEWIDRDEVSAAIRKLLR
jgi:hypothetical protein